MVEKRVRSCLHCDAAVQCGGKQQSFQEESCVTVKTKEDQRDRKNNEKEDAKKKKK